MTLNVGTGFARPFRVSAPSGSVSIRSSVSFATRSEIRICDGFASAHRRAARFVTVPIAP
jgi:hypothetical protein